MNTQHGQTGGAESTAVPLQRPAHILVVDDEVPVLMTLGALLRRRGYTVTVVATGHDALQALRRQPVDLLILDLLLPDLPGREVATYAELCAPELPVIILTGQASFDPVLEPPAANVVACVRKTSDPPLVLDQVAAALKQQSVP